MNKSSMDKTSRQMRTIRREAVFSACGRYRYLLMREWNDSLPGVRWIMLNPSTADAEREDPTIRRCIRFAESWGCGSVQVVNLFAWRATHPRDLLRSNDPIGPENDNYLRSLRGKQFAYTLCGWGNHASHPRLRARRDAVCEMLRLIGEVHCLKITSTGDPKHPLYCARDSRPIPYPLVKLQTTQSSGEEGADRFPSVDVVDRLGQQGRGG